MNEQSLTPRGSSIFKQGVRLQRLAQWKQFQAAWALDPVHQQKSITFISESNHHFTNRTYKSQFAQKQAQENTKMLSNWTMTPYQDATHHELAAMLLGSRIKILSRELEDKQQWYNTLAIRKKKNELERDLKQELQKDIKKLSKGKTKLLEATEHEYYDAARLYLQCYDATKNPEHLRKAKKILLKVTHPLRVEKMEHSGIFTIEDTNPDKLLEKIRKKLKTT